MTESAYPNFTLAQQIFKDVAWGPLVKGWCLSLFGASFLSIPVVGPLVAYLFSWAADSFYKYAILIVDLTAIKFVNAAHQAECDRISIKLRIIAHDAGIASDEFKKVREEDAKAFAKFVHFGAAS